MTQGTRALYLTRLAQDLETYGFKNVRVLLVGYTLPTTIYSGNPDLPFHDTPDLSAEGLILDLFTDAPDLPEEEQELARRWESFAGWAQQHDKTRFAIAVPNAWPSIAQKVKDLLTTYHLQAEIWTC